MICALGYLSFAVWIYVLPSETNYEGTTEGTFDMAVFLAYAMGLLTWPVYLPASVLFSHLIATLVRQTLPGSR